MAQKNENYLAIRNAGICWRDAITGLALVDEVERADKLVFPDLPVPINVFTFAHDFGISVQYTKDTDRDPPDAYEIYLPGISSMMRKENLYPVLDLQTTIRSIAIHEVRHRMQHTFPKLRLFSRNSRIDPERQFLIEQVNDLAQKQKDLGSANEFDAVFIGLLVIWYKPHTDDEIRKLLWSQPT